MELIDLSCCSCNFLGRLYGYRAGDALAHYLQHFRDFVLVCRISASSALCGLAIVLEEKIVPGVLCIRGLPPIP